MVTIKIAALVYILLDSDCDRTVPELPDIEFFKFPIAALNSAFKQAVNFKKYLNFK